jgi:hypothetical protein
MPEHGRRRGRLALVEEEPREVDLSGGLATVGVEHGEVVLTLVAGSAVVSYPFGRAEARAVALELVSASQRLLEASGDAAA